MTTPRYRCTACGNLTRFDVTISQKTKAFHHYTVGGEVDIEEETTIERVVEEVACRWCDNGGNVEEVNDSAS